MRGRGSHAVQAWVFFVAIVSARLARIDCKRRCAASAGRRAPFYREQRGEPTKPPGYWPPSLSRRGAKAP